MTYKVWKVPPKDAKDTGHTILAQYEDKMKAIRAKASYEKNDNYNTYFLLEENEYPWQKMKL